MSELAAPRQHSHGSRRRWSRGRGLRKALGVLVAALALAGCGSGSTHAGAGTTSSGQGGKATGDTTPPVITILSPAPIEYETNDNVTADYFCKDHGQPAPVCVGPVTDGNFVDMEPGTHAFTVEAEDASGNKAAPKTIEYTVVPARPKKSP